MSGSLRRTPQTSEDLQLERKAFPRCEAEAGEEEQICVSKAYLQRLFNLAKAQEKS